MAERWYLCIDLKSFYASVECADRGLDPMTTNLVVADPERSDKTICLAVSPSLKALGVRNRCRVFEIPPGIDYIMAEPRMQLYIDYAAKIYGIYLRYIAPADIHVYSIDEAFLDVTQYLERYHKTPEEMGLFLMNCVRDEIGVRATCGVGTNLYLAKIALDVMAKHAPNFIAKLTEESFREQLWDHRPLTDFWRIGHGTAVKLQKCGIETMRGIAAADEDMLYRLFGIDAELMIDHAWGRESTTIADIHAYKPEAKSLGSGQVLMRDYTAEEAEIIVKEMTDALCLELFSKGLTSKTLALGIRYAGHAASRVADENGIPYSGGAISLEKPSFTAAQWLPQAVKLYRRLVIPELSIRGIQLAFEDTHAIGWEEEPAGCEQLSLLDEADSGLPAAASEDEGLPDEEERRAEKWQEAVLKIKNRYGKNAVLRGMSFEDAATARERNCQIGGHKSGDGGKKREEKEDDDGEDELRQRRREENYDS